ncbi:MAG: 50S ribosomal protein L11 methyltransferase [Bacteroidaceae bacterium]|nr:50S ribosomal protein L11 methyltransferase [Bacteroidaceae bacterium]
MKYFELQFTISPNDEAAGDVLAALLADAGCDTFIPTDEGLKAYVLQSAYDEAVIQEATDSLASLLPGHTATFTCSEAPDENWNATWEEEHHFEPITLPNGQQFQILPRQAFGSGEHATTRMMLSMLAEQPLAGKTVIDAGCGTGVLSIAALKLGAKRVFAYDIDEWSVENAQANFALNDVEGEIVEGDASILTQAPQADLLLANINRNILLADLPAFVAKLRHHAALQHPQSAQQFSQSHLLLSGFLDEDILPLVHKAISLGLTHVNTRADGDWRALEFVLS